jgi:hypothetical protein
VTRLNPLSTSDYKENASVTEICVELTSQDAIVGALAMVMRAPAAAHIKVAEIECKSYLMSCFCFLLSP